MKPNTKSRPCPICGGHRDLPQGKGVRCWGFVDDAGEYAHCSREEHAGQLEQHAKSNAYAHKLTGECRCGVTHGAEAARVTPIGAAAHSIEAVYDYTTATGEPLFQAVRYRPKDFRQRRSDGHGGWIWKLDGVEFVPYRLPEVIAAVAAGDVVYIAEGEKDVEALRAVGCVATCNPMGAGKWREEYSQHLVGAHVVIIRDKDDAGAKHAREVFASVCTVAASVRVVEARSGKDAADHLGAGLGLGDFAPIEESAAAGSSESGEGCAVLLHLEDVEARPVRWLWSGRIPRGKVAIIDGDPDVGKSTITLDLAARVSTGAAMPDGTPGALGGVVLLSAEDDAADTIVPRLIAAQADLTRVRLLEGVRANDGEMREAEIPLDLSALEFAVRETEALLVVVDPLMAFLGSATNAHKDQDVRRGLAPLARLAARLGFAALVVRHLNKAAAGPPLYRGGGSIGIIGAARSGLLAARDPDDDTRRVLAVTKSNLAERAPSLSYQLIGTGSTVRVEWLGTSEHSGASLLAARVPDDERSAVETASEFLLEELGGGPVSPKDLFAAARRAGIADVTLRRAKMVAGVTARKTGMHGGWVWELGRPDPGPKVIIDGEDAQPPGVSTFEDLDHLRRPEPTADGYPLDAWEPAESPV